MKHRRLGLVLLVFVTLVIMLMAIGPARAAVFDYIAVTSLTGNCTSLLGIVSHFSYNGTNQDFLNVTWKDAVSLVLSDGYGTPFSFISIWVEYGQSGTTTNWTWNYLFVSAPTARPFTIQVYDIPAPVTTLADAQNAPLLDSFTFDPLGYGFCSHLPLVGSGGTGSSGGQAADISFLDGRINNNDPGAPIAVYGLDRSGGRGLIIYAVDDTSRGYPALVVDPAQIAAVPECPAENTLIASNSDLDIAVYRLTSCEYHVRAPGSADKTYMLVFDELYPNNGYTSFEQ